MVKNKQNTTEITTEQLINKIKSNLRDDPKLDDELLDILAQNVVKTTQANTAVEDAVKAIEALATKRVRESDDVPDDHD